MPVLKRLDPAHADGDPIRTVVRGAEAQAYEAGKTVPFGELFVGQNRRRIPLPGYPFQRRRYWIEQEDRL